MIKIIYFIFFICILFNPLSHAYDDETVHLEINRSVLLDTNTSTNLTNFLENQAGYHAGLETIISNQRIRQWIINGGRSEDDSLRWLNHFHDPLELWGVAGGVGGVSSIAWGQGYDPIFNLYSWNWARKYFFDAVTTGAVQDHENTFRSLGQIIHLIADLSVPAHVRNDPHPFNEGYELYTENHFRELNYQPVMVDRSIFQNAVPHELAPESLSCLWDINAYNGTNREVTWQTGTTFSQIGLAEYTNANFFSDDTLDGEYPFPTLDDTNLSTIDWLNPLVIDAEDGNQDYRIYLESTIDHNQTYVAAVSLITWDMYNDGWVPNVILDERVYDEYANRLVPLAVGYSAALIDYFFRGAIEISPLDQTVFTFPDANRPYLVPELYDLDRVRLQARNITPDEQMSDGSIHMAVRYLEAGTDAATARLDDYTTFSVPELNGVSSIPSETGITLEFDLGANRIPPGAHNIDLFVVYRGSLGMEEGAVAVGRFEVGDFHDIDISLPEPGCYSMSTADLEIINPRVEGFDEIRLHARNAHPDVSMDNGTIQLLVLFKVAQNDPFLSPPWNISDVFFTKVVSPLDNVGSIPSGPDPVELRFDISESPLPLRATDIYFSLMYQDANGTIGLAFEDASEPTPFIVFNNMDRICLNSSWFVAGSPEAIAEVDTNSNGIADSDEWDVYPHDMGPMALRFSPANNAQFPSGSTNDILLPSLFAGDSMRFFLITDPTYAATHGQVDVIPTHPDDTYISSSFPPEGFILPSVTNQLQRIEDNACTVPPCYARFGSTFFNMRGIPAHSGYVFVNRGYPDNGTCSLEDLE